MKRDMNILKSYQGEINLGIRVVKIKKAYRRKDKHKKKYF